MKKIIFILSGFVLFSSTYTFAQLNETEYLRRCSATPLPSKDVEYCRQAVQGSIEDIKRLTERAAADTSKQEALSEQDKPSDAGRIQRQAEQLAQRIESSQAVQSRVDTTQSIQDIDQQIYSLEQYLGRLTTSNSDEKKKEKWYVDNWNKHNRDLLNLRIQREAIASQSQNPASAAAPQLAIEDVQPNPAQDLPSFPNSPDGDRQMREYYARQEAQNNPAAATTRSVTTTQPSPAPAAPATVSTDELETRVDTAAMRAFRNQLARKDVENEFASLRHQNLSLQLRLKILQERYDNTLMGAYIQSRVGKLLQSNLICEKKEKCSPTTQDIPNLKDKLKTQVFQNTSQETKR